MAPSLRLDTIAFVVAIALVGGVSAFAYRTTDVLIETTRWVDRTHEVLGGLSEIAEGTMSAGPARRAYSLSGEASDLAAMQTSIERSRAAFAHVRELTVDNPRQQALLVELEPLLAERWRELSTDAVPGLPALDDAEVLRRFRRSKQIGSILAEMRGIETRVLEVRETAARRDAMHAKASDVAGTAASVLILGVAFMRLRRENVRRAMSEHLATASAKEAAQMSVFLDSIVENVPNMLFVKSADGLRFERINRAGEQLLGLSRAELVGKSDFDFFPLEEARFFQEKDLETLRGNVVVDIPEEPLETKNGRRWLHTKKVPIASGGRTTHLLGISEDITELREARRAAQDANRELEAFSYSVAHDLRAPLRSIDGFSQVLLEEVGPTLNDEARGHLLRVRAASQRMGELIDDLLMLSRVSRTGLSPLKTSLTRIASDCAEELLRSHPERDVTFRIAHEITAEGDPNLLRIALENLIGNAFKFTSRRTGALIQIGMTTTSQGGGRTYFVQDNGAGFDMRYADKLFRPFQRLHDRSEFEGTGIGLATVRRIIQRHGGLIWADAKVGAGATFYFTLGDAANKATSTGRPKEPEAEGGTAAASPAAH